MRRLPFKRGFTNINRIEYKPVNVGVLADFKSDSEVGPELLVSAGLVKKLGDPIVILGDGELDVALNVKAHRFSKSAIKKIEDAGGSATIVPLEMEKVR